MAKQTKTNKDNKAQSTKKVETPKTVKASKKKEEVKVEDAITPEVIETPTIEEVKSEQTPKTEENKTSIDSKTLKVDTKEESKKAKDHTKKSDLASSKLTVFPIVIQNRVPTSVVFKGVSIPEFLIKNKTNLNWYNAVSMALKISKPGVIAIMYSKAGFSDHEVYAKKLLNMLSAGNKIDINKDFSYVSENDQRTVIFIKNTLVNRDKLSTVEKSLSPMVLKDSFANVIQDKLIRVFQ